MQFDQVYSFLMAKLETELPSSLVYHTADHTKYVIAAAEQLASTENIRGEDLILLKTAALFHDSGFLQQSDGHEEISCILARNYLPGFGYSSEQIELICQVIMATRLPQSPINHLGKILADADLFYLGKENYTEYAGKLYRELKKAGIVNTETEWQLMQVEFLT